MQQTATTSAGSGELSPYLTTVLHDFFSHSWPSPGEGEGIPTHHHNIQRKTKKHRHQLIHIVCHNDRVPCVRNDVDIKARIQKREAELRVCGNTGGSSSQQKDWQLVHEFLGWAQTAQHHYVYVYYVGPPHNNKNAVDGDDDPLHHPHSAEDMRQPKHWKLVSKDHLALFHSRFNRHDIAALCRCLSSSDVTETGDGRCNLGLDVRFFVSKWVNNSNNNIKMDRLLVAKTRGINDNDGDKSDTGYASQWIRYRDEGRDEQMVLVTESEMRTDPPIESVSDFIAHHHHRIAHYTHDF